MVDRHDNQINEQPNAQQHVSQVSSKEFAAKYRSKREIYNFLATDVGVYLPPYDNITIYFLKELMMGKKEKLHVNIIR